MMDMDVIIELCSQIDGRLNDIEKKIKSIGDFTGYNFLREPKSDYHWTYYIEPEGVIYCFYDSLGHNFRSGKPFTFYNNVKRELASCGGIDAGTQTIANQPNAIDAYLSPTSFIRKYINLFLQE